MINLTSYAAWSTDENAVELFWNQVKKCVINFNGRNKGKNSVFSAFVKKVFICSVDTDCHVVIIDAV